MKISEHKVVCAIFGSAMLSSTAGAETLIDDFTTTSPAFGDRLAGDGIYDAATIGQGFTRSRDMYTEHTSPRLLPAEVVGGELVVTDLIGTPSFPNVRVIYDAADEESPMLLGQPMPGGPIDLSAVTEFRVDASGVIGNMHWAFGIAYWSGSTSSGVFPLQNGVNAIPLSVLNAFADPSNVHAIFLDVVNLSPMIPGSAVLDNFRIDLVAPDGDTDLDGDVDDADLGTAFSNYVGPVGESGGLSRLMGDTDGDGDVDDADLGTAFSNYTGPLTASVPEPGSLAVLTLGGLLIGRRRR